MLIVRKSKYDKLADAAAYAYRVLARTLDDDGKATRIFVLHAMRRLAATMPEINATRPQEGKR